MANEIADDAIEAYLWTTPNGFKLAIMMEELAVPYHLRLVDITKREQFAPAFLKISPNNRIPAIVDPDGPDGQPISIFESGAILQYLGRKFDRFYPLNERRKADVDQWLFWQVGGLGPMAGQTFHFRKYAPEKIEYGIDRYTKEVTRLYGVMDRQLAEQPYLAGEFSIADIASFPWVRVWEGLGQDITQFPHLHTWMTTIAARPAVQRGLAVGTVVT